MKKNTRILSLVLFAPFFICWSPNPNEISISITRLRNNKGQVLVCLFKDGDGYPDKVERAIRKGKATITGANKAEINFEDLPPGNYAAVILHDENNNQKMDKNWLGLPKEGYGFSNNVMGTFGPPGFDKASFRHSGSGQTTISITTKY